MTYFWYKLEGRWACCHHKPYRQFGPYKYSQPKDWLADAEDRMSAKPKDRALKFKVEEKARGLIWC